MRKRTVRGKQRPSHKPSPQRVTADERAFRALRDMKHGASASRAARENGISLRTLKKEAGSALLQDHSGGRYRARKSDRLIRHLQIPGPRGPAKIRVRGSKAASEAANYKAAVNRALAGDGRALAKWQGKTIAGVDLVTDIKVLKDQANKGLLPYSLYRAFSGGRR